MGWCQHWQTSGKHPVGFFLQWWLVVWQKHTLEVGERPVLLYSNPLTRINQGSMRTAPLPAKGSAVNDPIVSHMTLPSKGPTTSCINIVGTKLPTQSPLEDKTPSDDSIHLIRLLVSNNDEYSCFPNSSWTMQSYFEICKQIWWHVFHDSPSWYFKLV